MITQSTVPYTEKKMQKIQIFKAELKELTFFISVGTNKKSNNFIRIWITSISSPVLHLQRLYKILYILNQCILYSVFVIFVYHENTKVTKVNINIIVLPDLMNNYFYSFYYYIYIFFLLYQANEQELKGTKWSNK